MSTARQCSGSPREATRKWAPALLAALAIGAAPVLGACAREGEPALPAACSAGPDAVREALAAAPEPVRVDGTALSECFDDGSDGGEVQQIGAAYLAVAAELSTAATTDPGGAEAVQLAYLVGAVQRGASSSQGIHYELTRRLEQELEGLGRPTPPVREALRAGREQG